MGANDIEATFRLKDQVSSTLSSIDRNIASAGTSIERSASKTLKVFDKWNFSLSAVKLGFRALKFVASRDEDVGEVLNEGLTTLVRTLESLLFVASDAKTMAEFTQQIRDTGRTLAKENIAFEVERIAQSINSLESIDAGRLRMVMKSFIDNPDDYKIFQESVNNVEDAMKDAQKRALFLKVAMTDLSDGGLGLAKKDADALWGSMKKVEEEHSKATDKTKELADDHESAADAARKQKEAEDALLRTFSGGWNDAIGKLEDDFLVAGHAASRFAREAHSTISNDLFAALKGEAVSFGSFMSHILDGILRQVTDASAAGFLGLLSGGGGGTGGLIQMLTGGSSSSGGSSAISSNRYSVNYPGNPLGPPSSAFPSYEPYASGGTVTRPTFALIGEGGESEDIVPHSKRGAYVRAHGGGGGSTIVQFNVNAMDAASFDAYLRANGGRAIRDHVESAIRSRSRIRGLVN